ncbi:hypothetical protein MYX82_11550 [Acidobacteria bacterium AH-259-D05]|nr:hypothetical protein [Acidobacteria bacterium AH-259-D05]
MAKAKIPTNPDPPERIRCIQEEHSRRGILKIPPLPLQTGVLNAFTFDLAYGMIVEQGQRDGPAYVFCDEKRKFMAPAELGSKDPGFVVQDEESLIYRYYVHPNFENDPEAAEGIKDPIATLLQQNTFLYLAGYIPERFPDQMDQEIGIQCGYLSTERKHEVFEGIKQQIDAERKAEGGAV